MLTRCPQCATTFRVSPQQLKVHQGEVRCGRCSAIFDAFESLVAEPIPAQATDTPQIAAAGFPPVPPAGDTPEPATLTSADTADIFGKALPPDLQWTAPDFVPAPAQNTGTDSLNSRPKPKRRWPLIVLSVLAALLLIAQAAYYYRSELVANTAVLWPDSRPWLDKLCADLHCAIPLPRREDQVSIEASDLQVDTGHANLMLLTATLKNRAPFAQEYPLLALTLTDARDQAVARRVLAPADYLDRKTDSRGGFAANADLAIKVFIDSHDLKATGYRLFLFYR